MSEPVVNMAIGGQIVPSNRDDGPGSSAFRGAWVLNGSVIEVDVTAARAIAHDVRRRWRTWKDHQPFPYAGSVFSKDADSRDRISGAVKMAELMALAGQPFVTQWTDHVGADHAADQAWINGLFLAMGQHTAAVHAENKAKASQIELATVEQLEGIVDAMLAEMG